MNRLFWKILLTFWLSFVLLLGLLSLPNWWQQQRRQALETELVSLPLSIVTIKAAANTFLYGGQVALENMLREQQREAPNAMQIYALDAYNQEILGRPIPTNTLATVRGYQAEQIDHPVIRTVQHHTEEWTLFAPWSGQFPEFSTQHHINLNKKHGDDLLTFLGAIIASFFASSFLAWYFSHPVQVLGQGFQALAMGQLDYRVAPLIGKRRDELADLAQSFDGMAAQLEALLISQKQLMAAQRHLLQDVSHELRSPLTRLNMSIALARQQPERLESSLTRIEQEAERLDQLVDEVLTLAKLESGLAIANDEYLDLLALLAMLVEASSFEVAHTHRHIKWQSSLMLEVLIIQGNGELLYRALENIVRNAIHHTPPHTEVSICLGIDNQQLSIVIEDEGTGIPEAELDKIFEPFQRGSQSTHKSGYGLGLAIAQRAINFHHGQIVASNKATGGLRIQILLPWIKHSL